MRHVTSTRLLASACLLAALLAVAAHAQPAEPANPNELIPAQPPDSAPRRKPVSSTTAILRVVCDPGLGLANAGLIDSLLRSSEFMKLATPKVNDQARTERLEHDRDWFARSHNPRRPRVPPGVYMTRVTVSSYDKQLPAEKILESVRHQLVMALNRLSGSEERLAELTRLKTSLADKIGRGHKLLLDFSRANGVSSLRDEVARQDLARRQAEIQSMTIELEGLRVRLQQLEEQIAKAGKQTAQNVEDDPLVKQLAKVVELREKRSQVLDALARNARVASSEAAQREIELIEAKAELEKYRRVAAQSAGGERLAELQRRLEDRRSKRPKASRKLQRLQELTERALSSSAMQAQMKTDLELDQQEYREVVTELNRLQIKQSATARALR